MNIRPKTVRRVSILVVVLVVVSGAVAGLYEFGKVRAARKIAEFKTDGIAAFNAGDYPTAIEELNKYVSKVKTDPEALKDFAIARSNVPTLDASHISQAVLLMRRYTELEPDDVDGWHRLLELEEPVTPYAAETLSNARDLLRQNPKDLTALKAIALVQTRARQFPDALTYSQQYTDINPTDLDMQRRTLYLMHSVGRDPSELHAHADEFIKQFPDDPRGLVVKAMAYYYGTNSAETTDQRTSDLTTVRDLLVQASTKEPPDAAYTIITVSFLDEAGQYAASEALLEHSVAKFNDPDLTRLLVERVWQNHDFQRVVTQLASLNPGSSLTNVDLIAYKAMALFALDQKPEAGVLLATLQARDNDPVAVAWSIALAARFNVDSLEPKDLVEQYRKAQQSDDSNPVIDYFLGETYFRMGETDLALDQWREASALAPSWADPHIRVAEIMASQGQGGADAVIAAKQALITSSKGQGHYDYLAVVAQAMVRYAHLQQSQDPDEAKKLLDYISEIQKQMPGEPETLPIYVALTAETGNRDGAIAIIKNAEGNDKISQDLLIRLAATSRQENLGMESELYDLGRKKFGLTAELAYAIALLDFSNGRPGDGLQLLTDGRAKAGDDAESWDRVNCQYREMIQDPGAAQAWEALGDAYPKDLPVQSAILLDENSAWANRDFIDRTIKRLQDLTGDEAAGWKMARARWLLESGNPEVDASAAVVLLNDVLKSEASEVGPHRLMAQAYEELGNNSGAVGEWRQASDLAPKNPRVIFGLLRSLDMTNQPDDARDAFDRLAGIDHIPPDLALQAAIIMASEGDVQRARTMLVAYPTASNQLLHDATLAKVYRVLNQPNDAAAIYFRLSDIPTLDVSVIREAADFFASQHDLTEARKFLAKLDNDNLAAGQKELILADFEERYGSASDAAGLYAAAVKAAPNDPNAAAAQIGFLIRQKQSAAAQSATDAALSKWPDNSTIGNLKALQDLLAGATNLPASANQLIDMSTRDPQDQASNDTLQVLAGASGEDPQVTLKKLSDLMDKHPHFLPLYEVTVNRMIDLQRMNDAVTLASTAMSQFPESAGAAKLCAQTYVVVARWNDAITAAKRWRQLSEADPVAADILISVADLFIDQPQDAVDRLSPYMQQAQAAPDQNEDLIVDYCEALIRVGRESDASALLLPLAQKSSMWRADWLKMAAFAHNDAPSAIAWIEQVHPLLNANSLDDQSQLAEAYYDLALHRGYADGFDLARKTLKPFVDDPKISKQSLLTYALSCGSVNDPADAEHAYRQLLKLDPNQPIVQNNLADLLRTKGDAASLQEAESLARAAIAANGDTASAAGIYDTLARVLLSEGRQDDAIAAWEHGDQLQPNDLSILIGLADISAKTKRFDDALHYLTRIDALTNPNTELSPENQSQLLEARQLVSQGTSSSPVTTSPTATTQ
jgi:tetratricopeptide (TPR) repeat protein